MFRSKMEFFQVASLYICIASSIFYSHVNGCGKPKYSELQEMGAACSPNDTCSIPREDDQDTLDFYRCQCRAACIKSNTCCIDSDFASLAVLHNKRKNGRCQRVFKSNRDVIMVSKCSSRWRGSDTIRSKCETPTLEMNDPIAMAPVTNTNSETTYSNYFCAVCNQDIQFLDLWDIKITKLNPGGHPVDEQKLDQRTFLSQLSYNETSKTWGQTTQDIDGNTSFETVLMTFELPQRLKAMVTRCSNNIVSECHANWTDYKIRHKCRSYMGIIYLKSYNPEAPKVVAYRNIHCALCNFQDYSSDSVCEMQTSTPTPASSPRLSFTYLLDVNLRDGDKVGEVNQCGKGKIYDPFFEKCRTLLCRLPGYVIKGDKCVPPS